MKINVQAHRGASAYAPENTAPAFRLAVSMGADGVENDIRLTKDGVYVLSHDSNINRMSDGKGEVGEMTYEELLQYDFGVRTNAKFKGTKIATLKSSWKLLRTCASLISSLSRLRRMRTKIMRSSICTTRCFNSAVRSVRSSRASTIRRLRSSRRRIPSSERRFYMGTACRRRKRFPSYGAITRTLFIRSLERSMRKLWKRAGKTESR